MFLCEWDSGVFITQLYQKVLAIFLISNHYHLKMSLDISDYFHEGEKMTTNTSRYPQRVRNELRFRELTVLSGLTAYARYPVTTRRCMTKRAMSWRWIFIFMTVAWQVHGR